MNHQRKHCNKHFKHKDQLIQSICLHESCSIRPYVCRKCVKKQHRGHLIFNFILFQQMNNNGTIPNNAQVIEVVDYIQQMNLKPHSIQIEKFNILREYFESDGYQYPLVFFIDQGINIDNHRMVDESLEEGEVVMNNSASLNNNQRREQAMEEQQKVEQQEYPENNHQIRFNQDPIPERMVDQHQEAIRQQVVSQQIRSQDYENKKKQLLRYNSFRNQTEEKRLEKVCFIELKSRKITQMLSYIDVNKVTELTILNNATPCAINEASAIQISQMTKLKILKIFWTIGLSEELAIMMTKKMTNLEELCLSQFNNCSQSFVTALRTNNPNLTKINFTVDPKQALAYKQENIEFIPDIMSYAVPEKQWLSLFQGMRNLTSLELNLPVNTRDWEQYVRNSHSRLTNFTLTADPGIDLQLQQGEIYEPQCQDYTQIMRALQNCNNLLCLSLGCITFDTKSLVQVFKKNKNIKSFLVSECPQIKNQTYRNLFSQHRQLQELSIQINEDFTASSLHNLTTLKTLVLRDCLSVKQNQLIVALEALKQLKCVCLDFNTNRITRQTIKALRKLPQLKVLNISNNNLAAKDIQPLKDAPQLTSLICTNNHFSYRDLMLLKIAERLTKLSIGKTKSKSLANNINSYEEIDLRLIANKFPCLTHLKLAGYRLIGPQQIKNMKSLICLTLVQCHPESVNKAREFSNKSNVYFNC